MVHKKLRHFTTCQPEPGLKAARTGVRYYLSSPGLRKFVKYYWIVHVNNAAQNGSSAHISPSGYPELIFHFGDPVSTNLHSPGHPHFSNAFIAGQLTRPIQVTFHGFLHCLCVKLQPWALKALFDTDSMHFTNKATDLSDVLHHSLYDQLSDAENDQDRIETVERLLVSLLKKNHASVSPVTRSVVNFFRNNTHLSLRSMEEILECSGRTIQRRVREDVGMSPKLFHRIIRFNNAYHQKKINPGIPLQDLAFNYGYYDQAHFINEFKEFTGQSPRGYFKNESVYNSLFAGII